MENTVYEQETQNLQYAGFWWRFLAYIIDDLIIGAVSWIFILPILGIYGISLYSFTEAGMDPEDTELLILPMIGAASAIGIDIGDDFVDHLMSSTVRSLGHLFPRISRVYLRDPKEEGLLFLVTYERRGNELTVSVGSTFLR